MPVFMLVPLLLMVMLMTMLLLITNKLHERVRASISRYVICGGTSSDLVCVSHHTTYTHSHRLSHLIFMLMLVHITVAV
jgi:hypothetical protein